MLDVEALAGMLAPVISEEVEKAVAPLNARIAELEARKPVPGPPGEKGDTGERGADGTAPEPKAIIESCKDVLECAIKEMLDFAMSELPPPDKGEKGETGERGESGEKGADGKDGRGVKDLLIDRQGNLVATMDDGSMKSLGAVCGKDGLNGSDGLPGQDGRDGFALEDFDCRVLEDDRTIELSFRSGEHEHLATLKWPTVIDRGVYKAGDSYDPGDAVSWGGSLWIAQRATAEKPDTADSGWRLSVKRGRDGKDAKNG